MEKTLSESIMDEVKYIVCFNGEVSKVFCRELEVLGKRVISLNELRKHYEYIDYYVEFFSKIVHATTKILGCTSD